MTAPHFFVEDRERLSVGDRLRLSTEDSAHALRSRRLRPGETVTVSNGGTWLGRGRLAGEEGGQAVIELDDAWPVPARRPELVVKMAPPKGQRLSWAVQKLAELGVGELKLMQTEHSIRHPGQAGVGRLAVVAREAAMQSAQPTVMAVSGQERFEQSVASIHGIGVLLHQDVPERLATALPDQADTVHLLVGPEGGFSDAEVDVARASGLCIASLGPSILRTETAAVVGAALVLARYGRLG